MSTASSERQNGSREAEWVEASVQLGGPDPYGEGKIVEIGRGRSCFSYVVHVFFFEHRTFRWNTGTRVFGLWPCFLLTHEQAPLKGI